MRLIVFTFFALISVSVFGQIPKKKKTSFFQKSMNLINDPVGTMKDEGYRQLSDARAAYDSANFQYAIDLVDNSAIFRNKDTGAKFRDGLLDLGRDSGDKTTLESAQSMINTGEFFYASESYRAALVYFFAAQLMLEDEGLTNRLEYPKVLADLGMLYHTMGRYTLAREYTEKALDLRKDILGPESSAYAASLNNLAVLTKDVGEYTDAENTINNAIEISKKKDGDDSLPYAFLLNNKAMLSYAIGRYDAAEDLMQESLDIASNTMKEKQGNYQRLMTNLAMIYADQGEYGKAEEIYLNAIDIHKKRVAIGKKSDPDYAHMLNNLAALYVTMDRLDEVEPLLKESILIYQKKFGQSHPTYAGAVNDMARFRMLQGDYDEAFTLNNEVMPIRKRTLGEDHPQYIETLEDRAIIRWKLGQVERAEEHYKEVMDATLGFVDKFFDPMSESEKTKFWNRLYPRLQRYYSFAIDRASENPAIMKEAFEYHLVTKAMLMSETSRIRNQILSGDDDKLKEDFMTWLDQKELLAYYYSLSKEEQVEEKVNLDSMERATNEMEKSLSSRSSLFDEGFKRNTYSYSDLVNTLEGDRALIDIIRVERDTYTRSDEVNYLALMATKDSGYPEFVVIENGAEIETKYYSYYRNVIKQQMTDEFSYDQYWSKIDEMTSDYKNLYVSLDGIYNQISLPTLNDGSQYLIDKKSITILSSSRDLLDQSEVSKDSKQVLLVGNPDFGGGSIAPLPGTKKELETISSILKQKGVGYKIETGAGATESSIKNQKEASTLHVATHGYFQKDPVSSGKIFGISADHASNNPLLRSGLMFSNASATVDGGAVSSLENSDNGLLTAYEAMNLTMDGLQTVVLSACETGLGDVRSGEGVYGLQRAFLVAGAESLLMSLWTVNDEATQKLMTSFYQNWTSGKSKEQSLREAQLKLKTEFKHPYYWGAFVMVER